MFLLGPKGREKGVGEGGQTVPGNQLPVVNKVTSHPQISAPVISMHLKDHNWKNEMLDTDHKSETKMSYSKNLQLRCKVEGHDSSEQ